MTVFTTIAIIVILLVIWKVYSTVIWKTVMTGSDLHSEENIREKYEQLKSEGIRCKLKSEIQNRSVATTDLRINSHHQPNPTVLKLLVHRKDKHKINELV
ncbi:hypothetical protein ACFYKX_09190 [Cytobacillus sp. FJAT-54145]|uniref:Uncharacterized protein n=1 Tax=Cytobacillus spartinae TaxID=3299023 RepID=A0ABW6KD12_9BACI